MDIRAFARFDPNVLAKPLQNGVSRRAFLKAGAAAGGGLLLSFTLDCEEVMLRWAHLRLMPSSELIAAEPWPWLCLKWKWDKAPTHRCRC